MLLRLREIGRQRSAVGERRILVGENGGTRLEGRGTECQACFGCCSQESRLMTFA
jgi:hypothetical protein